MIAPINNFIIRYFHRKTFFNFGYDDVLFLNALPDIPHPRQPVGKLLFLGEQPIRETNNFPTGSGLRNPNVYSEYPFHLNFRIEYSQPDQTLRMRFITYPTKLVKLIDSLNSQLLVFVWNHLGRQLLHPAFTMDGSPQFGG